jgi:hypothetical protein
LSNLLLVKGEREGAAKLHQADEAIKASISDPHTLIEKIREEEEQKKREEGFRTPNVTLLHALVCVCV